MGIRLPVLCVCRCCRYWIASVCLKVLQVLDCQCCVFVGVAGIGLPMLCVCRCYGY